MGNIKAGFIGCGNMGGVLAAVAAKSLGLALRTLDPLPTEYSSGLRKLANAIANPAHD